MYHSIQKKNLFSKLNKLFPIILLFCSVLNEFDFNNLGLKYFSFNFSYILIYYYSLKKSESLGYGLIFIAGLFNDVVLGIPMGISSLVFLLICGAAAYLRNITLQPNLMKDWIFFLFTILTINSVAFIILTLFFDYEIDITYQIANILFTFLFYICFFYLFNFFERILVGKA
jgi:rod shape-determining protein MreD